MTIDQNLPGIDMSRPHPARRYNYWLGGKDNYAADRESGDEIAKRWPHIVTAARENRLFLQRAVRFCAQRYGIRQFLDIGTGLPTADNTHEVAQQVDPTSRIVYVDNDPLVLVHARALLTSAPTGATSYIQADLRDPGTILDDPALTKTLDLGQPVALLLVAILHFIGEQEDPYRLVEALTNALAPGSLLVLSHGSYDLIAKETVDSLTQEDYPGKGHFHPRTQAQVARFFTGCDLVQPGPDGADLAQPGLGVISEWGRPAGDDRPATDEVSMWGGVGRLIRDQPAGARS